MSPQPSSIRQDLLAFSPVELCSGIDALYLSAQGTAPALLFADLEAARSAAEASALPIDANIALTMRAAEIAHRAGVSLLHLDIAGLGHFSPSRDIGRQNLREFVP